MCALLLHTSVTDQARVAKGKLVCPESGREFPVKDCIPDMLLNDDESSQFLAIEWRQSRRLFYHVNVDIALLATKL